MKCECVMSPENKKVEAIAMMSEFPEDIKLLTAISSILMGHRGKIVVYGDDGNEMADWTTDPNIPTTMDYRR